MFLNVRSVLLCVGYYAKQSKWTQNYHKLPITDEEREGERKRQRKRKTKRKIKRKKKREMEMEIVSLRVKVKRQLRLPSGIRSI